MQGYLTQGRIVLLRTGPGTGTTISFEITFEGYTGAVEVLVVDTTELDADSGTVISAEVISLQEGTEPLQGDFTLSFRGQETAALSYDADADEVTQRFFRTTSPSNTLERFSNLDCPIEVGISALYLTRGW